MAKIVAKFLNFMVIQIKKPGNEGTLFKEW